MHASHFVALRCMFDGSLKDVNGLIKRTRTRWYVQVKQAASLEDLKRDTMNHLDLRRYEPSEAEEQTLDRSQSPFPALAINVREVGRVGLRAPAVFGASVVARSSTGLALQLFLIKGFELYLFQSQDPKEPCISICCHLRILFALRRLEWVTKL